MENEKSLFINLDRREYIDPDVFPDHDGMTGYIVCMMSLWALLTECEGAENGGDWAGDRVIHASNLITSAYQSGKYENLVDEVENEFKDVSLEVWSFIRENLPILKAKEEEVC